MRGEPGLSGRASLILGIIVALVVVGGGTALVIVAGSGSERDSASAGSDNPASTTTSSTRSSTTTTTIDPAATTTTTAPAGGSDGAAPSGYATADPEDTPYEPIPPPAGISAALQTCSWESTNGGELQATGTITAAPDSDDVWLVTVYWLQNDRELDSQTEVYELEPTQTLPWRLTIGASLPPLDLRCALEID